VSCESGAVRFGIWDWGFGICVSRFALREALVLKVLARRGEGGLLQVGAGREGIIKGQEPPVRRCGLTPVSHRSHTALTPVCFLSEPTSRRTGSKISAGRVSAENAGSSR
jgi:hypothetical protein